MLSRLASLLTASLLTVALHAADFNGQRALDDVKRAVAFGPRPAGPQELARYELWHKRKLCVQPGITCLWQIRGRNQISNFDDWGRMDFEYIDNWSLWHDIAILCKTVPALFNRTGAY